MRSQEAPSWLAEIEQLLVNDPDDALATGVVLLAAAAGRSVSIDSAEAQGSTRRALVLLAAGGDPARGLDLNGRAVSALADDLDAPDRRLQLQGGLTELQDESAGLPHVSEALRALAAEPDLAWRAYACSLLAEELGGEHELEQGER